MKLSEAIRLGSMLHPQGFGKFHAHNETHEIVASCALGAAEDAGYSIMESYNRIDIFACPRHGCGSCFINLGELIVHMNDIHRMSRERIADHIESIEIKALSEQVKKTETLELIKV